VDATNVTAFARRSLTRIAARHDVAAIAIVLDLDPALVQARNATRSGRVVPAAAVDAQLRDLERSLRRGDLEREGFAAVHRYATAADVDAIRLAGDVGADTGRRAARPARAE
jgi:predicted kinase